MNELMIPTTRSVFEIEPNTHGHSPQRYKAILAMQATGLYVAGDERFPVVNARLNEAAEKTGLPPTITYGDLVFSSNVAIGEYVPVISSDPEAAADEGLFYTGCRQVEAQLYGVISHLANPGGNPDRPGKRLEVAITTLEALNKNLTPERSNAFRRFFVGLNGYPGPGESYSEAMPILNLLVNGGRDITPEEQEEMRADIEKGLYPDHMNHTEMLARLLEANNPQAEMADSTRATLVGQLGTIRTMREQRPKITPV
jgi:hypothetical protein